MKQSTKIDVLDILPYGEANALVNKALRHIEEETGEVIEKYEMSIAVDYTTEPKPVSVEISGCCETRDDIEVVTSAADAEYWTVYTRRLVDGETPASAEADFRTLNGARREARRLAERYGVPYTGVKDTDLDIRGLQ